MGGDFWDIKNRQWKVVKGEGVRDRRYSDESYRQLHGWDTSNIFILVCSVPQETGKLNRITKVPGRHDIIHRHEKWGK